MIDKQFRDFVPFVKFLRHQRLFNLIEGAICHRDSRGYPQRLTGEASLAKKLTGAQQGDDRFFALLGCHCKLHLALTEVE